MMFYVDDHDIFWIYYVYPEKNRILNFTGNSQVIEIYFIKEKFNIGMHKED